MADNQKQIRTRFAPSPTGFLHVGNLRTALYAYLVAKQNNGKFILRVEDTDQERYVEGSMASILRALYWVGIPPDEGVVFGEGEAIKQVGDKGPYIQSERLDLYKKYSEQLLEAGNAYYCFCSTERLDDLRKFQQKNKLPAGYDQHCLRTVKPEKAKERVAAGERHVMRLNMPKTGESQWTDLVRGEVSILNELVDDQVLIKSDGFPTYHLAVVVDDHLMEITHVIRGDEWISSTPKHIQLYKYFGWELPQFAHLPLFLNADKTKLSKRQGDVSVDDYRAKGYLPEAMLNFMAFLGWNPGTEKEIYSLGELVKDFSFKKVGKAGAVFNLEKLDWYNKEYLKKIPMAELVLRAKPFFVSAGADESRIRNYESWAEPVIALERERITTLAELPEAIKFVFELPEYDKELLVWRKGTIDEVKIVLPELKEAMNNFGVQWTKAELEAKVGEWIKEKGYSTGSVLWPLRVSLSGQQNSPGPYEIAEVLGKDETLRRIDVAISKLS